jgi:hypothetical protein
MNKFYFAAIAMFAVTTAVMADNRPSVQGGVNLNPSGQVSGELGVTVPLSKGGASLEGKMQVTPGGQVNGGATVRIPLESAQAGVNRPFPGRGTFLPLVDSDRTLAVRERDGGKGCTERGGGFHIRDPRYIPDPVGATWNEPVPLLSLICPAVPRLIPKDLLYRYLRPTPSPIAA